MSDADLAPVLGATAAGTATKESSRGLAITVLGELMRPTGGSAWTQTMGETLGLLGVREKAARQTIARLHQQGWLDRTRVGRRTRWSLTGMSRDLLTDGAARIYGFGIEEPAWTGEWVVLLASVPERQRDRRYRLSVGLSWAGFGSLGQGTWISPWPDREAEAVRVMRDLGVDGFSFAGSLGELGAPRELAAQAWDLAGMRSSYDTFNGRWADVAPVDAADIVRDLVLLVHQWRRFPLLDPGLPAALLADDWPGREAVDRFAELRSRWAEIATRWWLDTDERFTPG
ncbi:MAG: PaaX family transcriptional regulator C-terminal domain-containing protein [Actinomycetota bacterium]